MGVDIGTSSIKVVELSQSGHRKKLENYGEIKAEALYEKPFRTFEKSTLTISSADVVRAISAILEETGIKTKQASFSIPDFSTFFTTLNLPPMTKDELPQAVTYEARQHIPLPLSEVTLDWQIIKEETSKRGELSPFKILLVAVPNEVIGQYQEIARAAELKLLSLEAEVFGMARALVPAEEKEPVALADIGARSTTISIVDEGLLKVSHSFDTSGSEFNDLITKGLNVDSQKAEELKRKYGLMPSEYNVKDLLLPLVDLVISEIQKIIQNFSQAEQKTIKKIILAGGSALLPGLTEYVSQNIQKPAEIADPFFNIFYPPLLEKIIKEIGPSYAIAVGMALRGFEI